MPVRKILVAFDGTEAAYRALEQAVESAPDATPRSMS